MLRQTMLAAALAAIGLLGQPMLAGRAASADTFPSKPMKIIVPFGPGGSTDITARLVGRKIEEITGQGVVVENKPGATGAIGTGIAKQAPADGYTLLLGSSSTLAANPHMYKQLAYDADKDFTPITVTGYSGNFVLVNKDAPYRTLKEFLAAVKGGKPGAYFAGYGNATSRVPAALLANRIGVPFEEVSYRDAVASLQDLIADRVHVVIPDMVVGESYVKGGQVRAIAVTSLERVPQYPDLPAVAEEYPGYQLISFSCFAVRSEVPADIKQRLNKLINDAVMSDAVKTRLNELGLNTVAWDIETSSAFVRKERELWAEYVKVAKIEQQ